MPKFDPSQLPDLTGFVVIVTGGHSGLGLATTTELTRHGAKVYVASRSRTKVGAAIQSLKEKQPRADVHFLCVDLSDLESVKKGVEEFLSKESKLHILINNAGIMCVPYSVTNHSFEIQLQTNYISHFLLTRFLLPTLLSTVSSAPPRTVRIINVSSDGHAKLAPKVGIEFSDPNLPNASTWTRYGQSKLANVLHTKELAHRYPSILSLSLHPGTVKTNLSAGPRRSTPLYRLIQPLVELGAPGPEKGDFTTLFCAASPDIEGKDSSGYFVPVGKHAKASVKAEERELAGKLWDWTEARLRECGF